MGKLCSHTSYSVEILDSIIYELEYSDYDAFEELRSQKRAILSLDKSWHILAELLANEDNFIGNATIYGYYPLEHNDSSEYYFSHLTNQDLKRTIDFLDSLKIISNYKNFNELYLNSTHSGHKDEERCKSHYDFLSKLYKFHKECAYSNYGVLIDIS